MALRQHGAHLSMQLCVCIQEPPHSLLLVQGKIIPAVAKLILSWSCLSAATFIMEILQDSSASSSAHGLSSHEPLLMSGPASCRQCGELCKALIPWVSACHCKACSPPTVLAMPLMHSTVCVRVNSVCWRKTSSMCCIPVNCVQAAMLNSQLGTGDLAWASSDGLPVRGFHHVWGLLVSRWG